MWSLTVIGELPSTVGSTSAVWQDKLCLDNVPCEGKACMTISTMLGMSLAVSRRGRDWRGVIGVDGGRVCYGASI